MQCTDPEDAKKQEILLTEEINMGKNGRILEDF